MFKSARIKLTLWYLLIIMMVSLLFSAVIYRVLTLEINRFDQMHRMRIEQQLEEEKVLLRMRGGQPFRAMIENPELINETKNRILFSLVTLNGGIFIVAGVLGYLLAGRTLRPIEEMTEEQNRFVSDASHEIKTPLTSLKTAFEVFLRSKKNTLKDATKIMQDSIIEVDKIQTLSEALLKLAHFEKPHQEIPMKKISIENIITAGIEKVQYLAKAKDITFTKDVEDFHVIGNKDILIDLVVILLDNAVKYSDKKNVVTISSSTNKNTGVVRVKDNGIGIAEKDIPHVFNRFYRSDKARSKSYSNGYGLGLSIAKKIVEQHNGSIQVSSPLKKGSTFTIRIPLLHT